MNDKDREREIARDRALLRALLRFLHITVVTRDCGRCVGAGKWQDGGACAYCDGAGILFDLLRGG